ncbi:hypothetical protein BLJ79_20210 [Arthrobacter sp. UCD-GKA]|uniref:hypothetical protein n=1 Tax=Arthrobacter sp. UCD-GKA TaxID=1913576 RepID=UPI0008DCFDA9|nr:hypothetical protein [Arthrobacter sp. UCD-GKA]OIH82250.1 hypothetical protein BLJ79_20210 [Arthrobacter sp. UCD-GKA]
MADSKPGRQPPEQPGGYKRLDSFDPLRDAETLVDDEETQDASTPVPGEASGDQAAGQDPAAAPGMEGDQNQDER